MSTKVPQGLMRHQKHHNCQCHFCLTHREADAKDWEKSHRMRMSHHAKHRQGMACDIVSPEDAASYGKQYGHCTSFNPDYPEAVNQTERNAHRLQRQQQKPQCCAAAQRDTPARGGGESVTNYQQAYEDLDELEKLLIAEHKARVEAACEADRLTLLRSKGSAVGEQYDNDAHARHCHLSTQTRRYPHSCTTPESCAAAPTEAATTCCGNHCEENGPSQLSCVSRQTIHDAFERAHRCPVTALPQCQASRELQDTLNDLRMIVMDPLNKSNGEALRQVIEGGHVMPPTLRGRRDAAEQTATTQGAARRRAALARRWRRFVPTANTHRGRVCCGRRCQRMYYHK